MKCCGFFFPYSAVKRVASTSAESVKNTKKTKRKSVRKETARSTWRSLKEGAL